MCDENVSDAVRTCKSDTRGMLTECKVVFINLRAKGSNLFKCFYEVLLFLTKDTKRMYFYSDLTSQSCLMMFCAARGVKYKTTDGRIFLKVPLKCNSKVYVHLLSQADLCLLHKPF